MAAAAAKCSWSRTTTASPSSRCAPARVQDGQWFVIEGLKAGDRVVVEGFQKFAAGDKVRPQLLTEADASADFAAAAKPTAQAQR